MTERAMAVDQRPKRAGRWSPLRAYLGALLGLGVAPAHAEHPSK